MATNKCSVKVFYILITSILYFVPQWQTYWSKQLKFYIVKVLYTILFYCWAACGLNHLCKEVIVDVFVSNVFSLLSSDMVFCSADLAFAFLYIKQCFILSHLTQAIWTATQYFIQSDLKFGFIIIFLIDI